MSLMTGSKAVFSGVRSEVFLFFSGGLGSVFVRVRERPSGRPCSLALCHCDLQQKCLAGRVWRWFRVAGAGNRVHRVKLLDFVALCDDSAVCACAETCSVVRYRGKRKGGGLAATFFFQEVASLAPASVY